jgi:hypothetical protein
MLVSANGESKSNPSIRKWLHRHDDDSHSRHACQPEALASAANTLLSYPCRPPRGSEAGDYRRLLSARSLLRRDLPPLIAIRHQGRPLLKALEVPLLGLRHH